MARVDAATGTVTVYGPSFRGTWTQGGSQAIISSADRCSLAFSMMLHVTDNGRQVVTTVLGTDVSTGNVVVQQDAPFQAVNSIAYYVKPE